MPRTFRDHFSTSSPDYARYRPGYPRALFEWIADEAPARGRAWDAATGSGQAAAGLAADFSLVVATDASSAQLAAAEPYDRVRYVRSVAEAPGLAGRSMDVVTCAQAVHWFDRPAFFREVARVARPGALVAVWTYATFRVSPEIDRAVGRFYTDVVGPYWPPERRLVEREYRDVEIPFAPVSAPDLTMQLEMTLASLEGYLGTWSATQRYREAAGEDPVAPFMRTLAPLWGTEETRLTVWPIAIRAGRV